MAQARPNTADNVRHWLDSKSSDSNTVFLVVEDRASGGALGFIQAAGIDSVHGVGTLGIGLVPAAQGQGFASVAISLLEDYLIRVFRLRKLVLQVLAGNKPALRVYEKAGFKRSGKWKKHRFVDGKYQDVLLLEKFLKR